MRDAASATADTVTETAQAVVKRGRRLTKQATRSARAMAADVAAVTEAGQGAPRIKSARVKARTQEVRPAPSVQMIANGGASSPGPTSIESSSGLRRTSSRATSTVTIRSGRSTPFRTRGDTTTARPPIQLLVSRTT